MKIKIQKGYVLVVSESLVRFVGRIGTGSTEAKGLAFFPFIFVRSEEFVVPWVIDHELIHHRQEIETLFIGVLLISSIEFWHARLFLKKNTMQSYLYTAAEQEAYLNMRNPDYLSERKLGALFHYVVTKRDFILTGPGEITFLD